MTRFKSEPSQFGSVGQVERSENSLMCHCHCHCQLEVRLQKYFHSRNLVQILPRSQENSKTVRCSEGGNTGLVYGLMGRYFFYQNIDTVRLKETEGELPLQSCHVISVGLLTTVLNNVLFSAQQFREGSLTIC